MPEKIHWQSDLLQTKSRPAESKRWTMLYWGFLAVKILGIMGGWSLLWFAVVTFASHAPAVPPLQALAYVSWNLPWSLTVGAFVVLLCGLVYLAWWDHAYRCRVCCRKLRMPVTQGSWSRSLTDRPNTEYICAYGHGKLSVPESQLTGLEASRWTSYGDIWQELFRQTPARTR